MSDQLRQVLGVDFSSAPSASKPIVVARGQSDGRVVRLGQLISLTDLPSFEQFLQLTTTEGWTGAFDFPFGLPRAFVTALENSPPVGWAVARIADATDLIQRVRGPDAAAAKQHVQRLVDGWGKDWAIGQRPDRLPHRQTDLALQGITSTSPLQTRYVPVGKMYVEGLWRLLQAPIHLPLLRPLPSASNCALEGYPALLAHEMLQGRPAAERSYKNDAAGTVDPARLLNRLQIIDQLEQGRTCLELRLKLTPAQRDHLAQDTQGDRLDSVLCMLQAAWAARMHDNGHPCHGLNPLADPIEGWILGAAF